MPDMNEQFTPPLPTPTPVSRPFWDGLQEHQIRLQHCEQCKLWIYYPRSCCPQCLTTQLTWGTVSGAATLYTVTIARQPTAPHFAAQPPQKIAVVELTEGVRLTTTLVNVAEADIQIGMALEPMFDQLDQHTTLLRYQPAAS